MNDRKKLTTMSTIIRGIEHIGDDLKNLIQITLDKNKFLPAKSLASLRNISEMLDQVYHLYYNFELGKLLSLSDRIEDEKKGLPIREGSRFMYTILEKMAFFLEGPICLKLNPEEELSNEDWVGKNY